MKWLAWITNVFGGANKSLGPLGIGLRSALGGGSPGGWASDHREETAHNTGFNYIAIHAIAAQVAGATVSVFSDGDRQAHCRSRRKMLAASSGTLARWKSIYGADDRETDPLPTSHPLVRLLKRPNPHESGASFRYRQAQQVRLTGTCLVWNVPSVSGRPCERYVIPTAMATPVGSTAQLPRGGWRINPMTSRYTPIVDDGYIDCPSWYRILGQIVDARQIQVIRLPHAWYLDDGQSPLSAGAKWVDAGEAVDVARYHQLRNGVDPSVVWNLPPDVSPDQDEIDRVQAKISAKYGGPENVGRVMVAQSGTSITPLTTSPKDMCYTEGFHDFKAAILALHQTPPVAVGLQEPGAYAAYNASMKAWRHAAVQPLCDLLAESDTEILAPQFGSGLTVEIESDTVDDAELVESQLRNDLAAKVRTKNEWRAVRGMPPLPGPQGDDLVGTDNKNPQGSNDSSPPVSSNDAQKKRLGFVKENPSKEHSVDRLDLISAINDSSAEGDNTFDDLHRKAELIAEILYGIYGERVQSIVDTFDGLSEKAWDPDLHPRDRLGRFARRGTSEESLVALTLISRILSGQAYPQEQEVWDALVKLTRSQLEAMHRELEIIPPPRLRNQLIRSVLARLSNPVKKPLRIVDGLESENSSAPIRVFVRNPNELNRDPDELNDASGRTVPAEKWAKLVGAPPGSEVHVYKRPGMRYRIEVVVFHADYKAHRAIRSDTIENVESRVRSDKQGQGLGARILWNQVQAAIEGKFERIETGSSGRGTKLAPTEDFAGHSSEEYAGYYVWPRLGFDSDLKEFLRERRLSEDPEDRATYRDFKKQFPTVRRVSELMLTDEGKKWWQEYGGELNSLVFDLRSNSQSILTLTKYMQEKELLPKSKSYDFHSVAERQLFDGERSKSAFDESWMCDDFQMFPSESGREPIEDADPLSEEEERILDRVWEQIALEKRRKEEKENSASDSAADITNES